MLLKTWHHSTMWYAESLTSSATRLTAIVRYIVMRNANTMTFSICVIKYCRSVVWKKIRRNFDLLTSLFYHRLKVFSIKTCNLCLDLTRSFVTFLDPLNMQRFIVFKQNFIPQFRAHSAFFAKEQESRSFLMFKLIECHYSVGRHLLARYLKVRCCIDCNYPFTEAMAEFVDTKRVFPFDHILCRFVIRRFGQFKNN